MDKKQITQIKYDLAIAYAKSKLDFALSSNSVPLSNNPQSEDSDCQHEVEYLIDCFYQAQLALDCFGENVFVADSTDWLDY